MKPTCVLFLIPFLTMACAASMQGTSYATPLQPASAVRSANASGKNHPRNRASVTPANRSKRLPYSRKRSMPENAMNSHQPGSDKSGGAAKGGLVRNEPVNNALPVRPTSAVRAPVTSLNPSLNCVRHRGPNPAVVTGSANSNRRNAGAINGTLMHRRP
jgi:hypothetical protein